MWPPVKPERHIYDSIHILLWRGYHPHTADTLAINIARRLVAGKIIQWNAI